MVGIWSRRSLLASSVALAACASRGEIAAEAQPSASAATIERTRDVTVPGVGETTASSGKLTVPAVRADASSGTYQLAFVRIYSPTGEGRAPIVYLEGGPGSACTWMADNEYGLNHIAPLVAAADVILLDQRGTGQSQPDATWSADIPINPDVFVSREIGLAHYSDVSRRAVAHFQSVGLRLDSLTNEENAHDVDSLRQALGLEKVSLFGFSYGTHLALTVLRRHGPNIERAILVGTEGPDDNMKLPLQLDRWWDRIAAMAAADPNVAEVGDLWALFERVSARLDREPVTVTVRMGDAPVQLRVGAWGLHAILRMDIGDASDIPVFPRLLYEIDRGELETLTWFVQKRASIADGGVHAMNQMVDGADLWTPGRLARIQAETRQSRWRDVSNMFYPEIVEAWPLPTLPADHLDPVRSDVPTLFLSGELDWNTPPAQAAAAAANFSRATLITVGFAGHEQTYPHPEARAAVTRFLRGEDVSGLAPSYPPLRFVPLRDGVRGAPSHPSGSAAKRLKTSLFSEEKRPAGDLLGASPNASS